MSVGHPSYLLVEHTEGKATLNEREDFLSERDFQMYTREKVNPKIVVWMQIARIWLIKISCVCLFIKEPSLKFILGLFDKLARGTFESTLKKKWTPKLLGKNGHLPLIYKLCNKIFMFWNYLAKYPYFWNSILTKSSYKWNLTLAMLSSMHILPLKFFWRYQVLHQVSK